MSRLVEIDALVVLGAVVHDHVDVARDDIAGVRRLAGLGPGDGLDVVGPFPSGLVSSAPNGHTANVDQFELPLREGAGFVGTIKAFQDHIEHFRSLLRDLGTQCAALR